jgi:hypothetical protein
VNVIKNNRWAADIELSEILIPKVPLASRSYVTIVCITTVVTLCVMKLVARLIYVASCIAGSQMTSVG